MPERTLQQRPAAQAAPKAATALRGGSREESSQDHSFRFSRKGTSPAPPPAWKSPTSIFGHSIQHLPTFCSAPLAIQPKLKINQPGDRYEQEADRVADMVIRMPDPVVQRKCACGVTSGNYEGRHSKEEHGSVHMKRSDATSPLPEGAPPIVREVLRTGGDALNNATQERMQHHLGHDFAHVRVHTNSRAGASAKALQAQAYTVGNHVVFGDGQFDLSSPTGIGLLAHELTHVVQQRAGIAPGMVQRRVEMRDVGRGEQSGIARLPELIDRLNAASSGLTFAMEGVNLVFALRPGGSLDGFDTQMMGFINDPAVIPMRLTDRNGLLGTRATGFNDPVGVDAFDSGYVDIDDLLASNDLALQSNMLHVLAERANTARYAQRIGSGTFSDLEFSRGHTRGIEAEAELMRAFFGDPSIRVQSEDSGSIMWVFINDDGDRFTAQLRTGHGAERGLSIMSISVRTAAGETMTAAEYREHRRALQAPEEEPAFGMDAPDIDLGLPRLELDPAIEAMMMTSRMQRLFSRQAIFDRLQLLPDLSTLMSNPPGPTLSGMNFPSSTPGAGSPTTTATPSPALPETSTTRQGTVGDLARAFFSIPAVDAARERVLDQAGDQFQSQWSQATTGERIMVITGGVVVGGSALAGVLSNPDGRSFLLEQLADRTIPIPATPMSFRLDLLEPDLRFNLMLDVGALLPDSSGFGPGR